MLIQSLLDTDLYKFSMLQLVWRRFPDTRVRYRFYCRSNDTDFSGIELRLKEEIAGLSGLSLSEAELDYLRSLGFFREDFLGWLRLFRPEPARIHYQFRNGQLELEIAGLWAETILFEIPLLAMISELFLESQGPEIFRILEDRLETKMAEFAAIGAGKFTFTDFGTRRRASRHWQREVLFRFMERFPGSVAGSSNLLLAKESGLAPVGTMAHEYLQACQVLSGSVVRSQEFALKLWAEEYEAPMRIALTDVIGLGSFLSEFSPDLARSYSGVRHDSGDPFSFGEAMIRFYQKLGIDPLEKSLIFSDSLNFQLAREISDRFRGRIDVKFGIGTFLTNDRAAGCANIVIKMTHCNGMPVAKISDNPDKSICEDAEYYKKVLEYRNRFCTSFLHSPV
ncbi:MAG: nicotinate phosphoribosyltransferase [Deltaproteobacteria bacterium]|nr:nicotinate phosphoribosyltransferase [Deltaproteobacteria bacterium]